jgi:hypothetical protein
VLGRFGGTKKVKRSLLHVSTRGNQRHYFQLYPAPLIPEAKPKMKFSSFGPVALQLTHPFAKGNRNSDNVLNEAAGSQKSMVEDPGTQKETGGETRSEELQKVEVEVRGKRGMGEEQSREIKVWWREDRDRNRYEGVYGATY